MRLNEYQSISCEIFELVEEVKTYRDLNQECNNIEGAEKCNCVIEAYYNCLAILKRRVCEKDLINNKKGESEK